MEAKELMIGDWVQYTDIVDEWGYVPQGKVSKLTHHATFDEQKGSRIQIELPDGFQFYNDIEEHFFPIPLTLEMLEKNGYKIGKPFSSEIKYPCFFGIYPELKFQIAFWERDGDGYWIELAKLANLEDHKLDSVIKKHFHYVHELQHALRLAGIKKEIVL